MSVVSYTKPVSNHLFSCSRSAGFGDKESLTYEDFKLMMKEFKGDFLAIGLDCKGAKQNYLDATTNVARLGFNSSYL